MPSYERNKSSGLWSCRFRETHDDGTVHYKRLSGFPTKREAQYGYEDYLKNYEELQQQKRIEIKEKEEAKKAEPDNISFDYLLSSYLTFTQHRVKESSFYDIKSKIKNRLVPFFTGKTMSEITPKLISDWIEGIEYSYSSKKWILSTLSSIYKYGEKYFDIKNIMSKVDRPRNLEPQKEMQIWTPQEFTLFIKSVENPVYKVFYYTLYLTGCRRGEVSALTWQDIDFDNNTIKINKSLTTKTERGKYIITTPKNNSSVRTISMPDNLSAMLTNIKEDAAPSDFVFGGTAPLPSSSIDYVFNKNISRSGVKKIRIHDLRHSCASLLISKGVSIVAVSRRLGHTNTEQTLNTYSHLMPDDQKKILSVLECI